MIHYYSLTTIIVNRYYQPSSMNYITTINHSQPPVSMSYLLRSAAYRSGTTSRPEKTRRPDGHPVGTPWVHLLIDEIDPARRDGLVFPRPRGRLDARLTETVAIISVHVSHG